MLSAGMHAGAITAEQQSYIDACKKQWKQTVEDAMNNPESNNSNRDGSNGGERYHH